MSGRSEPGFESRVSKEGDTAVPAGTRRTPWWLRWPQWRVSRGLDVCNCAFKHSKHAARGRTTECLLDNYESRYLEAAFQGGLGEKDKFSLEVATYTSRRGLYLSHGAHY